MAKSLAGMHAALMTALGEDGEFHAERQIALTERVMNQGLTGLYVGGSSGESGLLDAGTLLAQQEIVAGVAKGRPDVLIAHVGLPSLAESVRLARNAAALGYDALSALPPHSYPFTDGEILGYYRALAAATDLPLIVYEIPIRTGRPLPLALLSDLLDLPNVAGIKYTSTDLFKLSMLRRARPDRTYFFGFDEIFTSAAALGCDGGIGTTYNLMGKLYVALFDAMTQGNLTRARELQDISQRLVEVLFQTGVLPGMKTAFRLLGLDIGPTRAPMAPQRADHEELLTRFLDQPDVKPWLA